MLLASDNFAMSARCSSPSSSNDFCTSSTEALSNSAPPTINPPSERHENASSRVKLAGFGGGTEATAAVEARDPSDESLSTTDDVQNSRRPAEADDES